MRRLLIAFILTLTISDCTYDKIEIANTDNNKGSIFFNILIPETSDSLSKHIDAINTALDGEEHWMGLFTHYNHSISASYIWNDIKPGNYGVTILGVNYHLDTLAIGVGETWVTQNDTVDVIIKLMPVSR